MPRSAGTVVENNFVKGLISEATGLNFPENACVATENCKFELTGQVSRRKGIDIESSGVTAEYTSSDGVLVEFLWRAVSLTGTFVFLCTQIGENISIYNLSSNTVSTGLIHAVNLADYRALGGASILDKPCQFGSGGGRLFITHPSCTPIVIEYNDDTSTFTTTAITIKVRDFEGVDDGLDIDEQPSTLSNEHYYNLKNQGWYQNVRTGDVTP